MKVADGFSIIKCGEQGHAYCACPLRTAKNDKPQASKIATQDKIKEDYASCLCYA